MTRSTLVIPGGTGGPMAPLPMYSADAAELRGATVHHHWWTQVTPGSAGRDLASALERADADLGPLFEEHGPARPLVIAKSLGSSAAPYAAKWGLPAIWLTPILTHESVVAGLRAATAPFLLVGGTADGLWDGELARSLTPHVFEVDGANHGMYVDGPLQASLAVLGDVVAAVEAFIDAHVWPVA
ncbi:hypothetical protein Afil01_52830 [Actinorhabdospora filicis]|uniref:Alpha/beta hydrolase n=1 Tax=Actinorhabdospora filicis TaxID=1785913 RepID=A0A9W6SQM0_9ACTN|nr:alpha/beta hydrolase [Actinorhabdospora filicis]GLZ80476.1 hypothetical protein Afil01_52830 [Actinorhabdospora filicis]